VGRNIKMSIGINQVSFICILCWTILNTIGERYSEE
jgi:hypothetical protein